MQNCTLMTRNLHWQKGASSHAEVAPATLWVYEVCVLKLYQLSSSVEMSHNSVSSMNKFDCCSRP